MSDAGVVVDCNFRGSKCKAVANESAVRERQEFKFNYFPFCHFLSLPFLSSTAPTASILGGPDFYVQKGSTINLTCTIRLGPDESPAFIFWYHEDEVMGKEKLFSSNDFHFLRPQAPRAVETINYDDTPLN